jgi:hypothetical protein
MSLLFYAKSFLELGNCKEYLMARKTDGTTTPKKKASAPGEAAAVQPAPAKVTPGVRADEIRTPEVRAQEVRSNVTPINVAPVKAAAKKPQPAKVEGANLDEDIRRLAYELFLQRNGAPGDPAADWIVAEREVRARHASKESALAASQGS